LVSAADLDDRERRWRAIGAVFAVAPLVRGFEWVAVDVQPDHESWRLEKSTGEVLEWDPESPPAGERGARRDSVEVAKGWLRTLVPLELKELHHFVDWAQVLDAVDDGGIAAPLTTPLRRLALDLPKAPTPPTPIHVRAGRGLAPYWLAAACIMATAFTVSMAQAPGPGAFVSRLTHFLVQGASLWVLGTVLLGITSNGWPRLRVAMRSGAAVVIASLLWSALPF
jgi:hypothetical protein